MMPYASYITDAMIRLTYRSGQTTGPELLASMVTSSWSNGGITRNNEPSYKTGGIYGTLTKDSNGYYKNMFFSITNMARLWNNSDDYENMGIKMSYAHFSYDTNTFGSANGDAARSPSMLISYSTINRDSNIENNGVYYLRNRQNGQYLDLQASSYADGTPAQTFSLVYDNSLCWEISGDSGYYMIRTALDTSRYILLDARSNCVPGAQVAVFGHSYRTNSYGYYYTHSAQLWDITPVEGGYYKISPKRNMDLSLSVAASGESATGNPRVTMETSTSNNYRQQWYLEKKCVAGTDYKIKNKANEKSPAYYTTNITVNTKGPHHYDVLAAIFGWNLQAGTNITYNSSSSNIVDVDNHDDLIWGTLGDYTAMHINNNGQADQFRIRADTAEIDYYARQCKLTADQTTMLWRHTIAHEFGHALGLKDEPTGRECLMKYHNIGSGMEYQYWTYYYPQTADIVGMHHYFST